MTVVINGTTGITSVNGTAGAPSVTGTDTDTGIVYGTNTLSLATGGTTAVTVDSSQNVGIGTSSPAYRLQVHNGASSTVLGVDNGGDNSGAGIAILGSNTNRNWFIGNQYNVNNAFEITPSSAAGGSTFTTPALVIDASGNFMVGTTSVLSYAKVGVSFNGTTSNALVLNDSVSANGAGYAYFQIGGTTIGSITRVGTGSTVNYATSSDYRLKENVLPMTGALSVVQQLKPCTYTWKVDGSDGQGFIAHELAEVCPDAVVGEKDAVNEDGSIKAQGIDTSFLVATLTAAIQELNAKVDAQAAEIAALKAAS